MKDKEKAKAIAFALSKITTEQFAIIESNLPIEGAETGVGIDFRFSASEALKMIGVFATFKFQADNKQFLIVEGGCHFKIKPEDWENLLNDDRTRLTIPKGLLGHLATITIGTTRGILHAKTENTSFSKYYLPIINVREVIKKDSVFNFKEEKT